MKSQSLAVLWLTLLSLASTTLGDDDPRFNPVGDPGFSFENAKSKEKAPVVSSVPNPADFGTRDTQDASPDGVKIGEVEAGLPAAKAGLKSGDKLTVWNKQPIRSLEEYLRVLNSQKPGDVVEITYQRDGQPITATVTLATRSGSLSPAFTAGLREGDIILAYGGQPTPTGYDLSQVKEGYAAGETIDVKYRRGSDENTTRLKLTFYENEVDGAASFKLTPGGGHSSTLVDVLVSPARREAVSYDGDGIFIVWGVDDMKAKKRFILPNGFGDVRRAVLARDGRMLGLICKYGVKRSALVVDLDRLDIAAFLPIPENRNDLTFEEIAIAPDSSSAVCVQNLWDENTMPLGETRLTFFDLKGAGLLNESAPAGIKKPTFVDGHKFFSAPGTGTNPVFQGRPDVIAIGISDGTVRQWSIKVSDRSEPVIEPGNTFSFLKDMPPFREKASMLKPEDVIAPRGHPWRNVIQSWLQPVRLAGADNGELVVATQTAILKLSSSLLPSHWQSDGPRPYRRDADDQSPAATLGIRPKFETKQFQLAVSKEAQWVGTTFYRAGKCSTSSRLFTADHSIAKITKIDLAEIAKSLDWETPNAHYPYFELPGRTWDQWDDSSQPLILPISESEAVVVETRLRELLLVNVKLAAARLSDGLSRIRVVGKLISSNQSAEGGVKLFSGSDLALSDDNSVLAIGRFATGPRGESVAGMDEMFGAGSQSASATKQFTEKFRTVQQLAEAFRVQQREGLRSAFERYSAMFVRLTPALDAIATKPDLGFYAIQRENQGQFILNAHAGMWSNQVPKGVDSLALPKIGFGIPSIALAIEDKPSPLLTTLNQAAAKRAEFITSKTPDSAVARARELAEITKRIASIEEPLRINWQKLIPNLKDTSEGHVIGRISGSEEPCWLIDSGPVDQGRGLWRTSLNGDGGAHIAAWGLEADSYVATADGKRVFVYSRARNCVELYETLTPTYLASGYLFAGNEWVWQAGREFFAASPKTLESIGWSSNQGLAHPARYFTGDQLFNHFHRPDIIQEVINRGIPASKVAERLGLKSDLFALLRGVPTVELIGVKDGGKVGTPTLSLAVKVSDVGGGIHNIEFFHNGKRLVSDGPPVRGGRDQTQTFTVNFQPGKNELKADAYNADKIMSSPAVAVVDYVGSAATINLHVLAIGVNHYQNERYNLNYCVADADALVSAIQKQGAGMFKQIIVHQLKDDQVLRPQIEAKFKEIAAAAEPQDMFVFIFAGHGTMGEAVGGSEPSFYLVPQDVTRLYGDADQLTQKAISGKQLEEWSASIKAQKQLMLLDTCQSGGLVNTYAMRGAAEEKAIAQLSRATGTTVIASTGTEQYASEVNELGHGIFTYAILQALEQGKGDTNKDGKVTVKELERYVNDEVPELTQKYKGTAQYPNSYSRGQDFPVVLAK